MDKQIFNRLNISPLELTNFCQENHILQLLVFGSVLREDFTKTSDIDFLVVFDTQIKLSLIDLVGIQYKLEEKIRRKVDLIEKRSIENSHNWIRRKNILETTTIIYESGQILSA
ncbi:nucleotidyltransferase domain-containing protein [Crocosphaera sp.]|uniref:nucleotidyltransferase family protein n=1 Tax=Crocosphaera sp. TaxID=2729996 RepID=UPI0026235E07|nr:nucleotidyltransferase domain-containing protein [Crocosphaera sp.]MDJ0578417.1 nucleotidyltransferase domain-containing protein [Crocosphaera sp.]